MKTQTVVLQNGISRTGTSRLSRRWVPASIALALGLLIVSAVGFAGGVAHQAAHDGRHVMAFPCH